MIIDFRLRPPYADYLGTQMYDADTIGRINRAIGSETPTGPRAAIARSMHEMIREMDEAEITTGVAQGRHRPGTEISNAALHRLTYEYPGRFVALASVNALDSDQACAEIDRAVGNYRCPGVSLDLAVLGMHVNDRRVYPIYEHCVSRNCFVAITLSMLGAQDLDLINPRDLDRAAHDFPKLNFVSAHGSYPYVLEAIGVAMKRQNVWLCPDMYMTYAPGGDLYVQAANTCLQDRIVFGTGYPYAPLKQSIDRFMRMPLADAVREKLLCENAKQLLKPTHSDAHPPS